LADLEQKIEGATMEALQQNESFISATLQATSIALRTKQEEKLDALRNAVLNVAAGDSPDEDIQSMFLQWVDNLTSWHLRILKFFQDPKKHTMAGQYSMGGPAIVLESAFPHLRGQREFYDQVVRDLHARGLMAIDSLHTTMAASGVYAKRTTALADDFLAFISPSS
jgi:hypothetical protein